MSEQFAHAKARQQVERRFASGLIALPGSSNSKSAHCGVLQNSVDVLRTDVYVRGRRLATCVGSSGQRYVDGPWQAHARTIRMTRGSAGESKLRHDKHAFEGKTRYDDEMQTGRDLPREAGDSV